jgi:hypothetical protein
VSIAWERSLREHSGEWHGLPGRIGQGVDDVYFTTQPESDCNWKSVEGNAFGDIHAEFVHPAASLDTSVYTGSRWQFYPDSGQNKDLPRDDSKRHAQLTDSMIDATVERNEQLWSEHVPDRAHRFPDDPHLLVYPNGTIGAFGGKVRVAESVRVHDWTFLKPCRELNENVSGPTSIHAALRVPGRMVDRVTSRP